MSEKKTPEPVDTSGQALAKYNQEIALAQRIPTPDAWSMIMQVAPVMYAARLSKASNPEQAAAIMLVGNELGFGLAGSFQYIHIIEDKLCVSPAGALAVVLHSRQLAGWKLEPGDHSFHCWMQRKGGLEYEYSFSFADAKKAGLIKPEPEKYLASAWCKYEANMLKWRTIGYVLDVLFSDLIGGLKRADEFGAAVDDAGHVIEAEWQEAA